MGQAVRRKKSEFKNISEIKFKDRTEAQSLFVDRYKAMKQNDVFVINYHGYGGIGKSALCKHIYESQVPEAKSFIFNFETIKNNCDKVEILKYLANRFELKCGYDFTYFNYALYIYYRTLGKTNDAPEIRCLKNNPVFESVMDVVSFVPVIGEMGSTLIKNVDLLVAGVKELIIAKREEIMDLDRLSAEDIADRLIDYFIDSIYDSLLKEKRPIIIFLDTYEQFQNYIRRTDSSKVSEEFFWAEDGLIRQLPNILWVIAGHKCLTWAEDSKLKYKDSYWSDVQNISYAYISELEEDYVKEIFEDSKIKDEELIRFIIKKTNGVPEHIRMCIERYFYLLGQGINPTSQEFDFDYKTLAARYIGGLSDDDKDLIEILACLEKWTIEDITRLGKSHNRFENLQKLSFFRKDENVYFMQNAVREIVARDANPYNREISLNYLKQRLEDETVSETETKEYFLTKIKLQLMELNSQNLNLFFEENMAFIRKNIYDDSFFETVKEYLEKYVSEEEIPSPYNIILKVYQLIRYNFRGDYERSKEYVVETGIENFKDEMDTDTKALLYVALAECMSDTEKWNDYALEALDLCMNLEDDYTRIELSTIYAHSLFNNGLLKEAYEYTEFALKELEHQKRDSLWAGYQCELLDLQAKIHIEEKNTDEALLKYARAERMLEEYQNRLSIKGYLVAGSIFVCLAQLLIDENSSKFYAEKALEYTEKLYKMHKNRRNLYNVATAYRVLASQPGLEYEKKTECCEKAIQIFEELYSMQKRKSYLDGWFLTALNAFEDGIDEEKYIEMCKMLSQREDVIYVNPFHVYDFCKSLVIYHMNKLEFEELEQAMEVLNGMDYNVENLYVDNNKNYLIEKMWIYEKMGTIHNILGEHEDAYAKWREVNKIASLLYSNSKEVRFLYKYKESCCWLRDLCMEGVASECTLDNALEYSLEDKRVAKLFLDTFNSYENILEYVKSLNALANIYDVLQEVDKANEIAFEEAIYRKQLSEYEAK